MDSASAVKPGRDCDPPSNHPSCTPDLGGTLNYTVDLVGPVLGTASVRGTFEFENAASATLDRGALTGDGPVTMKRRGANADCDAPVDPDRNACIDWNIVFNLCGLLGLDTIPSTTGIDEFTVERRDWSVSKGGGKIWISFGFALESPLGPSNPLFTDRLSASLQLTSPCYNAEIDPSCENQPLIPTAAGTINTLITDYSIHLRGKGGVTHKARCHAGDGTLGVGSYLVITVTE